MSKFLVMYYCKHMDKEYTMKTFVNYPTPFQLEKWVTNDCFSKSIFKVSGYSIKDCSKMLYDHGHLPHDREGNYWYIKEVI